MDGAVVQKPAAAPRLSQLAHIVFTRSTVNVGDGPRGRRQLNIGGSRMQEDDRLLLVPVTDVGPKYLGGLGQTTVYKLIGDGLLAKCNIGRRAFVTRKSIEEYVDRLAGEARPAEVAARHGESWGSAK